ncbi:MAG: thioredoxin family protein [Sphingobacteriales bacterium]|nr:MAG: thioredoxin family protein [Sphingobacteriales bacterium]
MRFLFALLMCCSLSASANDSTRLYNPAANARKDVAAALQRAKAEKKQVLIQVGGNWCIWCYRFNAFTHADTAINALLRDNYVVYHLNYSKENKNLDYLAELGYPQRFGFPVMIVLDADGHRLHTQDSGLLEKGNGYDHDKVYAFLHGWARPALDPLLYKE